MSETVSLDVDLKSPIERVWHALTDGTTLSEWALFSVQDFRPVVGHRFHFQNQPVPGWDGLITGEVLEAEPPRRLSYTWEGGPAALAVRTTVTWTLSEPKPGLTRLHMEHSGFDPAAKQAIGGARYGWTRMLGQLQTVLAPEGPSRRE